MKQAASELREGEMYSSGSGMPLENVTGDDGVDKSTEISGPPHISSYVPLSVEADRPVVVFDVETTGLGSTAHIAQIAATGPSSSFCQYVLPRRSISAQATSVTGLSVRKVGQHRQLLKNGKVVNSHSLEDTCKNFVAWLRSFSSKPVLLVAHNSFSFDMKVLMNQFASCNLFEALAEVVEGFADACTRSCHSREEALFFVVIGNRFAGVFL